MKKPKRKPVPFKPVPKPRTRPTRDFDIDSLKLSISETVRAFQKNSSLDDREIREIVEAATSSALQPPLLDRLEAMRDTILEDSLVFSIDDDQFSGYETICEVIDLVKGNEDDE